VQPRILENLLQISEHYCGLLPRLSRQSLFDQQHSCWVRSSDATSLCHVINLQAEAWLIINVLNYVSSPH
jgi:hypothetical protein